MDVDFDASESSDPDGSIVSYDWDFGDGATGTGATPSHQFTSLVDRYFDVTLTVTDDQGATGEYVGSVYVYANRAPTAGFSATPWFGTSPLDVDFDGSSWSSDPDGSIVSYDWDFGDGATGTGCRPEPPVHLGGGPVDRCDADGDRRSGCDR